MQKRITSLVLVLAIVLVSSISLGLSVSGSTLYGDVNQDSSIDMKDVLALRLFLAKGTSAGFDVEAADCQYDKSVDMKDVLLLRKYLADNTIKLGPGTNPSDNPSSGETTTTSAVPTERTSKSRIPTEPSHHDPVDFSDQPQIDVIQGRNVTFGTWWWKIGDGIKVETRETILDFLKYNGITEIWYYCYDRMRTPNTRQETHEFVVSAMSRGMRVAELYDDPNSQQADNTFFTDNVVANFLEYKKEYPNDALYGIHCDVEHKVNSTNAQNYFDNFILPEVDAARAQGICVELDLSANYNAQTVKLDGKSYNFYEACAMHCDTMCIMSYRTTVAKINECVSRSGPYAKKVGTKIIFSIEMGVSGEGPGVDFSTRSKQYAYSIFQEFATKINVSDYPAGIGFAIHSVDAWYNLRNI